MLDWSNPLRALFEDSWNEEIQRFRSPYVFRGLEDARYELDTTLQRLGGNIAFLENNLIRNFKKYARKDAVEFDSIWNWITLAQHHGLPTRLLDWTYSPLVAMHFATASTEKMDVDGAIWMVNFYKAKLLLPETLREKLIEDGANVFTVDILTKALDLGRIDELDVRYASPFVIFLEPPSIDSRISNQYGLFSLMNVVRARMGDWLQQHGDIPGLFRKIDIPASLKWEIRDKLDQSNINERMLFPGLDGLCKWLGRHYSQRKGRDGSP
ncbi:MAG: FRG domain-containing protein [Candidatus Lokiarchaeota archaeon]|nr:FRG domain-containing protein [Candidatus Lokiarchaeota archaeon]